MSIVLKNYHTLGFEMAPPQTGRSGPVPAKDGLESTLYSVEPVTDKAVGLINGRIDEVVAHLGSKVSHLASDLVEGKPFDPDTVRSLSYVFSCMRITHAARHDVSMENYARIKAIHDEFRDIVATRRYDEFGNTLSGAEKRMGHVQTEIFELSTEINDKGAELARLVGDYNKRLESHDRNMQQHNLNMQHYNSELSEARRAVAGLRTEMDQLGTEMGGLGKKITSLDELLEKTRKGLFTQIGHVKREQSKLSKFAEKFTGLFEREEDGNYSAFRAGVAATAALITGLGLHAYNTLTKAHDAFRPIVEIPVYGPLTLGEILAGTGAGVFGYLAARAATRPKLLFVESDEGTPVEEYVRIEQISRDGPLRFMKARYKVTTRDESDDRQTVWENSQVCALIPGGPYDIWGDGKNFSFYNIGTRNFVELPGIPKVVQRPKRAQ